MKNIKQIALGLIVGALAIGFSSFTAVRKLPPQTFEFVHLAHSTSNLRTDYVYRSAPAGCDNSLNNCSSLWNENITGTPSEGDNPIPSATQVQITPGDYKGQ
ncbi:hypothetical protein G7092_05715 [Mucilaginibacter sp. HC2]|uniref:hypothetical protein n=1 Tax=Mucilaginibacter inviolabilis TaxID=2714892 RepID=UPI0014076AC0|nr:hypothetical protein [Mucilaginibacter inviolabilis]NHA03278.1 hypothetical protein [Mucilaginibacter inviolabilis]